MRNPIVAWAILGALGTVGVAALIVVLDAVMWLLGRREE